MIIDTHAHLWFPDYKSDLAEVIACAREAGVEKMIVPGTDLKSSEMAIDLAKRFPGVLYAAVGIHPEELDCKSCDHSPIVIQGSQLRELIQKNSKYVVAVGEIGTDKFKNNGETIREQMELMRVQGELAIELDLPVIIHTRESFPETWEVLLSLPKMPIGQFHCFSVDEVAMTKVLNAGFYISFCGNITWSKRVAKLVSLVPDERLLLETDSPFMRPRGTKVPELIGNRNEPANVLELAQKIAELRSQTLEKIEEMTTINAKRLFNI